MTTNGIHFDFIPNREVREIPKGWQHPTDARGEQPRLDAADALAVITTADVDQRAPGVPDDHEDPRHTASLPEKLS
jgi:hypothetical protein